MASMGFPGGSVVKNPPANAGDAGSIPGSGRSLGGRKKWQPTPVFLPGKAHGQRSLVGYSQWGRKELGHILGTKQQWPLCKDLSIRKWTQSRLRPQPSPGSTSPQNLPLQGPTHNQIVPNTEGTFLRAPAAFAPANYSSLEILFPSVHDPHCLASLPPLLLFSLPHLWTTALTSHASKVMLKILQARFQQCVNHELSDVQAGFRKGRGSGDQIANIHWVAEKAREFQK